MAPQCNNARRPAQRGAARSSPSMSEGASLVPLREPANVGRGEPYATRPSQMDATHSSLGPLQVIANVGHNKLGAARSSLAGKALLTLPLPELATIRHQGCGNLRLRETILESAPSYVLCRWLTQEPSGDKRGDRTHEGLESKVPLVDTVDQLAVPV
jgi:hypothetical protein